MNSVRLHYAKDVLFNLEHLGQLYKEIVYDLLVVKSHCLSCV